MTNLGLGVSDGPLGKTLHYLADFIAERPQPMRAPDTSFFVELLALIICPVGLLLFAISLVLFIRSGRRIAPRAHDSEVRI